MGMDIISLRSFIKIAELGSITHAAELLHQAQPSLTRRIHALEADLGVKLFARVNRGVRLTEAGERLMEGAAHILRDIDQLRDDVTAKEITPRGTVVLGITPTLCPVILPKLISALVDYPQIKLKIEQSGSLALPESILNGHVDLGILADMTKSRLLDRTEVAREEMVLVTGPQPIGIDGEIIDWQNLSRLPLILTHTIHLIMQKLMTSKEAHLNLKAEINSLEALRVLVQENQCATILPYSFCRREYLMGLFKIYRILDDSMKRRLIIATARARQKSPAVKLVSRLCSEIFSDLDSQGMFKIT
jgi:LysR family nitrogen assimilation transcriptional regulator